MRELADAPMKVQGVCVGEDKCEKQIWRVTWEITQHTDLLEDFNGGTHPIAPGTIIYTSHPAQMDIEFISSFSISVDK